MNVGVYLADNVPQSGGGYTYEQELFESLLSLANSSHHTFVFFSKESIKNMIPQDLSKQVRNELILSERNIFDLISQRSPLLKRLLNSKVSNLEIHAKKNQIDIMLFCNPFHEIIDIPYISVVWDLQHRLQPWFPEVSEKGLWNHREVYYIPVLQRATYIIAGTEAGKQEISFFYGIPEDRIKVLPLPTPNFVINNTNTKHNGTSEKNHLEKEYLIYPAQFWSHKNHTNFLRALKIVRETYKIPLSIIFVGSDKGNLPYIKKITNDLKLTEYVEFFGFVPREELIALYKNAFALVFPTFFGPDNLPPLEAFALRCPVIASRVSGAEEQLGDAALLFDPKKPEEIANAIISLYNNPALRNTLIDKGFDRALRWTGEDYMRGIFSIIDDFENIRRCWE